MDAVLTFLNTPIILLSLPYPTLPRQMPYPFFRIHLAGIHRDKRGINNMAYNKRAVTPTAAF
jgi:hypothetical protein